jgi:hypothetical protein
MSHACTPVLGEITLADCGFCACFEPLRFLLATLNEIAVPGAPTTMACALLRLPPSIETPSISRMQSFTCMLLPEGGGETGDQQGGPLLQHSARNDSDVCAEGGEEVGGGGDTT